MRFLHDDFAFEVSDEWWTEAGMDGFVPSARSYRANRVSFPGRRVYEVRIDDVAPVPRQLSDGVFNNDAETGLTGKDRVLRILQGFRADAAIPPVELVSLPSNTRHGFRLTHGAHRFYCALAAGFTHVPAVEGFDPGGSRTA